MSHTNEKENKHMVVHTYIPQAPLSTYVDYFWYFHCLHSLSEREVTLPDGATDLIIDLREEKIQLFDRQEKSLQLNSSILSGPHSEYFLIGQTQVTTVIGIRFRPGGAAHFLNLPMYELHNEHVSLDVLWGYRAKDLRDELLYAPTLDKRFEILEKYLLYQWKNASRFTHPAVQLALHKFQRSPHTSSISATVNQLGLSSKKFIQLFKEEVGLPPKRFCRLQRFHHAIQVISQGKEINWLDLAPSCGYYDQAHFIKEFQAFSGLTPTDYQRLESRHPHHVSLP